MSKPTISESLLYFLDEKTVCLDFEFPENGIELAYKMKAEEWNLLLKIWNNFSDEWKHAITFFAGFSYLRDSASLLIKALYEHDDETVEQALFSFYESIEAELDELNHDRLENNEESTSQISYSFSKADQQKIISELEKRKSDFKVHPELLELKRIIIDQS